MKRELPDHIYFKHDIDRAFNWGLETAVDVFEKSLGLSHDNQKLILDKLKDLLSEDKARAVMDKD